MDSLIQLINSSNFYEFAALLTFAATGAIAGSMLRQPVIIAYIVAGVIAGPSVLGIAQSGDEITLLAKMGIAILLFIVGLKLDIKLIKGLGVISIMIGLGQISLSIITGVLICLAMGLERDVAFLVALALSFSSTIIIVKLLSDKREIDSLHGRIALGVLIIQDLAVVVSMIVLATVGAGTDSDVAGGTAAALLQVAAFTVVLLILLGLFMHFTALHVVRFLAHNAELLLCASIAWAIFLAALCDVMGLSKELGGLLAGVSLASTPYRDVIISRLSPLRDFLLLFFFITLGIQLDLSYMQGIIVPALILSLFVLVFKPLIVMSLAGILGFRKRTGFLAGISLAQISEFSLIFIAMTYSLGLIDQSILGLVTLVALITITLSTYLLSLSHRLYSLAEPYLDVFERAGDYREQANDTTASEKKYDIILLGIGRYGQAISEGFGKAGKTVLAVDFNPAEIERWQAEGGDARYGDACDPEFFHTLPLSSARWVVAALPQHGIGITHEDPRVVILQALRENNFAGKTAVACNHAESADRFYDLGANVVLLPFSDAADRAVNIILHEG